MAAEDPDGQQKYWFMGLPFQGLNRDISEAGTQTYWFQGLPFQFLFPTSAAPAAAIKVDRARPIGIYRGMFKQMWSA